MTTELTTLGRTRRQIIAEYEAGALTAAGAAAPVAPTAPTAPTAPAAGGPNNAGGTDVPADSLCMADGCGHTALQHEDTAAGLNTGACSACACGAMTLADGSRPLVDAGTPANPAGDDDEQNQPGTTGQSPPQSSAALDPSTLCASEGCGHMASAHADTDEGENMGACSMQGCLCTEMTPPAAAPAAGTAAASLEFAEGDAGAPAAVAPSSGTPNADATPAAVAPGNSDLGGGVISADDESTSTMTGPAFTIPVMMIEGVMTDDGRIIEPGALAWRQTGRGWPLMATDQTTYGHEGALLVGRIDSLERNGANIVAHGVFDTSDEALEIARKVGDGMLWGVSADLGNATSTVTMGDLDMPGSPGDYFESVSSAIVRGATICPFPAFEGCFIVLDGMTTTPVPVQQPQQMSERVPAFTIIDQPSCESCDDGIVAAAEAIVAAGSAGASTFPAPLSPPAAWYDDPHFERPTPLTVLEDGRVFGHIALWGTCHVGYAGRCVTPPESPSDYAYFHQGRVYTAEGGILPAGALFMGQDHAGLELGWRAAMDHYASASTRVAMVRAGRDELGLWIAGSILPGLSHEQVNLFRTSAISGDWRPIGAGDELVAALAVNTPGFPIVQALVASGQRLALVGAGAPEMAVVRAELSGSQSEADAAIAAMFVTYDRALAPILRRARDEARARMSAIGMTPAAQAQRARERFARLK